jgi:hypothetical protein
MLIDATDGLGILGGGGMGKVPINKESFRILTPTLS